MYASSAGLKLAGCVEQLVVASLPVVSSAPRHIRTGSMAVSNEHVRPTTTHRCQRNKLANERNKTKQNGVSDDAGSTPGPCCAVLVMPVRRPAGRCLRSLDSATEPRSRGLHSRRFLTELLLLQLLVLEWSDNAPGTNNTGRYSRRIVSSRRSCACALVMLVSHSPRLGELVPASSGSARQAWTTLSLLVRCKM